MKAAPVVIDASDGPHVVRKVVVWRRLEPGDARTPGTEVSAESPHLEAKVIDVAISKDLHADLKRLWKKRDEVTAIAEAWNTRYEPAGVLFSIGGGGLVGVLLDYLPPEAFWVCTSFTGLGIAVGWYTRATKAKAEADAGKAWFRTDERKQLESIEKRLEPRWKRFAKKLLQNDGFRTEVGVGDIHEADKLVSIDLERISHPDTWKADAEEREVRYGWVFGDGRYAEQVAELEESDATDPKRSEAKKSEKKKSDEEE
jgi:hypothetical protein